MGARSKIAAALPLDDAVRDDALGRHQFRTLDVADELAGRLDAQLKGIEIHRREPGRGQFREKRIIERDDGNIFRDGKPVRQTGAPERHAQQIVADDDGGRPVRAAEQRVHGRVVAAQR